MASQYLSSSSQMMSMGMMPASPNNTLPSSASGSSNAMSIASYPNGSPIQQHNSSPQHANHSGPNSHSSLTATSSSNSSSGSSASASSSSSLSSPYAVRHRGHHHHPNHVEYHRYSPPIRPLRDSSHRLTIKLTTALMFTYNAINDKYYAQKRKKQAELAARQAQTANAAAPAPATATSSSTGLLPAGTLGNRGGVYNDGYDDKDYNYIIQAKERLNNRFVVEHSIGKGSFGRVVKAWDTVDKEWVALKIVKSKSAFYKQAQVEIKILSSLSADSDRWNVVSLKDYFVHQGHQCLVFELLSLNLYELLKNTRFQGVSLKLIAKFAYQLLQTLYFLGNKERKDKRIIHCDLKPENILLRNSKKSAIKVIDFGSACFSSQKTYTYIQSRFYRAPEILLNLNYSCPIDMWSLGCIARTTPISLCDGTAVPIEKKEYLVGSEVWACGENSNTARLNMSGVQAFLPRGVKSCVELTLEDGRTLTLTPDHKIYTKRRKDSTSFSCEWTEAKDISVNHCGKQESDRVAVGADHPLIDYDDPELTSYRLSINANQDSVTLSGKRLLIYCRLLGYLSAAGQIGFNHSRLFINESADCLVVEDDVRSLLGVRPLFSLSESKEYGRSFTMHVPDKLHRWLRATPEVCAARTRTAACGSVIPQFIVSADCPAIVIREFLGGLFGGAGTSYSYSLTNQFIGSIAFTASRQQSLCTELVDYLQQIRALLIRVGIPADSLVIGTPKLSSRKSCPMYDANIDLLPAAQIAFAKLIGFRYNVNKQLRLTAGVAIRRIQQNKSVGVREWLHATGASVLFKPRVAQGQLERNLESECESVDEELETENVRDAKPLIHYGIDRNECGSDVFWLQVVRRRDVGRREVFDLSVNQNPSFLANGVVVHNCILVELHTGRPLFDGTDEADQMIKQVEILGIPPAHMLERNKKAEKFFEKDPNIQVPLSMSPAASPLTNLTPGSSSSAASAAALAAYNQPGHLAGWRVRSKFRVRRGLSLRSALGDKFQESTIYQLFEDFVMKMLVYDPRLRIKPATALQHPFLQYVAQHCLTADTRVSLLDGTSARIADLAANCVPVMAWDATQVRFTSAIQSAFIPRGTRPCIELTLEDGRTIGCTPDHQFLVAVKDAVVKEQDDTNTSSHVTQHVWKAAGDLNIGVDRVLCGPDNPLLVDDSKGWQLIVGCTAYSYCFALRLARLLGYMMTQEWRKGEVYVRHALDAEAFNADVSALCGNAMPPQLEVNKYRLTVPPPLEEIVSEVLGYHTANRDIIIGVIPSPFPAFVLQADTPLSVKCEFIGGLFGGSKIARYGSTMHSWKMDAGNTLSPLGFGVSLPDLAGCMQTMKALLIEVGINEREILCQPAHESKLKLDLELSVDQTINFADRIGFRYCAEKQMKMCATAAYCRYLGNSKARTRNCMNVKDWLESVDAWSWFADSDVPRDSHSIPGMALKLVSSRSIGDMQVFDLTVDVLHNFTANGLVAHNCHQPSATLNSMNVPINSIAMPTQSVNGLTHHLEALNSSASNTGTLNPQTASLLMQNANSNNQTGSENNGNGGSGELHASSTSSSHPYSAIQLLTASNATYGAKHSHLAEGGSGMSLSMPMPMGMHQSMDSIDAAHPLFSNAPNGGGGSMGMQMSPVNQPLGIHPPPHLHSNGNGMSSGAPQPASRLADIQAYAATRALPQPPPSMFAAAAPTN